MRLFERVLVWVALAPALIALVVNCSSDNSSEPAPDVSAPAAVGDLQVQGTGCGEVTLGWTAPGDDGNSGRAASYDVRYSAATITEDNWASAAQCSGEPTPKSAGQAETFAIQDLTAGTPYHFALKTADSDSNESDLSNGADGTTASASYLTWINDGLAEDVDWVNSATELSANWSDVECVESYEYVIGTVSGIGDVIDWTSSGSASHVTCTGLALTEGQIYYVAARARVGAITGNPAVSDGAVVDLTAPSSAGRAHPPEVLNTVLNHTTSGSDGSSGVKD